VEVLTSYSHTPQLADLQRCVYGQPSSAVRIAPPAPKRPWSLQDRPNERSRADLIDAYRAGATAVSTATVHGVSARSVKRLMAATGVHRTPLQT
jgi:hypothetical protein